jgi:hypothetical protein
MRKQHGHGYELYNSYEQEEPLQNDYLGMFFAILAGICVAFTIVEHVIGVEGIANLIS